MIRPVPRDPARAQVESTFDLKSGGWLLTSDGEFQTGAAEAWKDDGSNWQRVVILEWPVRNKVTKFESTLRLVISPEDAAGLADVLAHTAAWLKADEIYDGGHSSGTS